MKDTSRHYAATWLGLFVGLSAVLLGMLLGSDLVEQWQLASRYTAQASYPLFLLTFIASSLVRLYPIHWTTSLMRNRRSWGLGFAACFFTHLAALLFYNYLIDRFPPVGLLDRGVWIYVILLAMVVTSTDAARTRLGIAWKFLHSLGMWAFMLVFVVAFYLDALFAGRVPDFDPLSEPYTLSGLTAIGLKGAAAVSKRRNRTGIRR